MRIALRIAGVIVVAYVVVVGFLWFRETELVYLGYARVDTRRAPSDTTLPWDSVRVMAADSTPVYLLVSEVDRLRRPWAIYFHGNAQSVFSRGNAARYRMLRDAGYNVVAVEYRGFGPSAAAGTPSERGLNADATAAWSWLTESLGVPADWVIVYGWSLGSGPAVTLASIYRPAALVTEGAFASLPRVASIRYRFVPAQLIMRNRFDNLARAPSVAVPWLIFHGRVDDDVPFDNALLLAGAAPRDQLIPLDADHNEGVLSRRNEVVRQVNSLVSIHPMYLDSRALPPHAWQLADRATKRLPPESFPQLPVAVRADLRRRGCRVPQVPLHKEPHNVISGSFVARGTTDWAVLCSVARRSHILVYRDGATAAIDDFSPVPDADFLQGGGNGTIEFSRRILPIRGAMMVSYQKEFGGSPPPPIDHLGIEDAFVGKASAVIYFYRGKWITLTGAD